MIYTVPSTTTLGEVLGLQFADAPGIATRQNNDGTWDLTSWPAELGSPPTQQQIDVWVAGIDASRATAKRSRVKEMLRDNSPERIVLRSVVKVLMQSLVESRTTTNAMLSAIGSASSLADLKAKVSVITPLTNRNWAQAMSAAQAVIDAGQAEG